MTKGDGNHYLNKTPVCIGILNNVLIRSIENRLGEKEVIFQDDKASCHRAKEIKTILQKSHIKSMTAREHSGYKSNWK